MATPDLPKAASGWPSPGWPSPGWFDGKSFVLPLRVYYEDTDFSGFVYHASYLRFMERGRSELLRTLGLVHDNMLKADEPLVWAVRRIAIDYGKGARVDDALQIHTMLRELAGARLLLGQLIRRDGEVLAEAEVVVCVVTLKGKPRRIPADIRNRLSEFLPS